MNIKNKLLSQKNKSISTDHIFKMSGNLLYEDFVELINKHVKEKLLEPVKSSGTNGRRPALYNKYRILKERTDYSNVQEDIKMLHPRFNHSKYAKHPEEYLKYKKQIDSLSKFLWRNASSLNTPMAINERSFQIWGEEKLLKNSSVIKSIFQYNNWDLSTLNFFETPEPFFEYVFSNEDHMNILIIENKDTWYSLRRVMSEDKLNLLFRPYHVLLYGEGKKIIRKTGRLGEYDRLLEARVRKYYYFGDIDYEGIDIFQTLIKYNSDLDICLCHELYSWMLREAREYDLPEAKKGQKKADLQEFAKHFEHDEGIQIENILEQGRFIPQEILNYSLFRSKMKEGLEG